VYLGYDELIKREVAIKVPNKDRLKKPEDAEAYLTEARIVASLDHPHIVPVFDVGRTQDGSIYVVSQFIEGITLLDRIKAGSLSERDAAQLLATVARALQHAHDRRLIHRDVKPANILLQTKTGKAYVTDFGLAIREQDYLQENIIAGTASYMSPEQARGEGHRLDERSDIFSMGIILYEILTGKKPFRGSSPLETLHEVISKELKRPRDIRESIPVELERICLKALSKLTSDRYATAAAFAHDLEHWLKPTAARTQKLVVAQVVPKGLRSFDAGDADFFLDLLPGPRNRDGLPDSISFWKQRIEETNPEQTFNVGLIYGPSGCGKSSLVKAGLLPHLSQAVVAIYVEATADETEARILRGLKKHLFATREGEAPAEPKLFGLDSQGGSAGVSPSHSPHTSVLRETLATLRRGKGRKVVIIIDQFEQWQLPTLGEWLSIRRLTDSKRWTEPERSMMQRAARVHGINWGSLLLVVLLVGTGIQLWTSSVRWKNLEDQTRAAAESLQNNLGPSVPVNLKELGKLPKQLVLPELQTRFASTENARHKLSLAFALANYGRLESDYLVSQIDAVAEADTRNFVTALQANPAASLASLKAEALKCSEKPTWRLKVMLAIAVMYCNWRSLHEGRTACYERTGTREPGSYDDKNVNSFWAFRQSPAEPANGNPHTGDSLTAREPFNDSERWTTTIFRRGRCQEIAHRNQRLRGMTSPQSRRIWATP